MAQSASLVSVVANRYAGSLFEVALESNSLDAVEADLAAFDDLLRESEDLMRLVRSPVFSADEQLAPSRSSWRKPESAASSPISSA